MTVEKVRGYCSQCASYCPTLSHVEKGIFTKVEPDGEHPNYNKLCPKGLAGPELVYSPQRLQYPLKRTRPKGDPDPGWRRITWDEALDEAASRLKQIKAAFGPESIAVARPSNSGSPSSDFNAWVRRLAHVLGTPNAIATTHICQWHRDGCSKYTFGNAGTRWGEGIPEFERAGCILLWGNNPHATNRSRVRDIRQGVENGAKLIVIDPRRTRAAGLADHWLQICPGTDGALALSMIHVMLEEGLYDASFVRDWTSAPYVVRSDTENLLKGDELPDAGDPSDFVILDSSTGKPVPYAPGTAPTVEPLLEATVSIRLRDGREIEGKTAFTLLREAVSEYAPHITGSVTWIEEDKLRQAVRTFATRKPSCLFTWNGPEQTINASQTNRALCILYALTGDFDKPGGNAILPSVPTHSVFGREFLDPETEKKRLGFEARPLGPAGATGSIRATDFYNAVLTERPYPVKALLSFGGNSIMGNPESHIGKKALVNLDFHLQTELFLTPSAELADILLPAASFWESWHIRTDFIYPRARGYVQYRPAVVKPRHESWPDIKIAFKLAEKLGLGDRFWNGDVEAAFNHHLSPAGITLETLKEHPGGLSLNLQPAYRKYQEQKADGRFVGFNTPSGRMEIYSQTFKDHGYDPLPQWRPLSSLGDDKISGDDKYPLLLTSGKILPFCHTQHRALPSLRKAAPDPFLEIHPGTAETLGIRSGEWVIVESYTGSIKVRAKLTDQVHPRVVCTQHGWWQACDVLGLPGYDCYSPEGANLNLMLSAEVCDPISGSLPLRGYPCRVKKTT